MRAAPVSRGMERGILVLFLAAAAVIALAFLLPAIRYAADAIGGAPVFDLLTVADVPHGGARDGVEILSASYQTARVSASGLSGGAVALLVAGSTCAALTLALTVGAVVFFVLLLMWRRPFHRALVVATLTAGSALLIGSVLAGGLGGLGRMMAATELNPLVGDAFLVGFSFDPAPVLAGVGILALSFVFDRGSRMQRDVDGLV
jgi:hypothetical protein